MRNRSHPLTSLSTKSISACRASEYITRVPKNLRSSAKSPHPTTPGQRWTDHVSLFSAGTPAGNSRACACPVALSDGHGTTRPEGSRAAFNKKISPHVDSTSRTQSPQSGQKKGFARGIALIAPCPPSQQEPGSTQKRHSAEESTGRQAHHSR